MNEALSRLRVSLWWLLPLAALAVVIGLETDLGRALRLPVPAAEPIPAKPVTVSLMPEYRIDGGISRYSETVSRPLFVPTRRPAPAPVVEAKKEMMKKGQFALTGTTVAGERSLAFLKEVTGGKARTIKLGDSINGLLVAEVKPDRVRLTLNDEYEDLMLKVVANPKMTPQPAGAPPGTPGVAAAVNPAVQAHSPARPQQPPGAAPTQQDLQNTQSIAERRRAARAAAAAAAAQAEAASPADTGGGSPPPTPAQQPQPGAAAPGDTGWAAIYQRYQQRRN